ncbi:hypothetical protein GWI33_006728 [Rhynchophorus ferrugineus]|uniref:Cytochrome oxidase complex assembly protein 1 n=1 Tax=Rhynchophorus ferrugineus TaxID=354439 RepID=A0A834IFH1_RHYFE|nr:hypothetical protein GWI33_006728 [Rhynchophorus ferrugineus]
MTLVKIAAVGGVATVTMGFMARSKIESNIKNSPICKEALKLVRTHPPAITLLGEPIKARSIDIDDREKNNVQENKAHFAVPLRGSKQKGTVYFWATRSNLEDPWAVTKVELEVENVPNKRLIIKNVEKS